MTPPTPNFLVTVEGHPQSPFRVYSPDIGVLAAEVVKRHIGALSWETDKPFTRRAELTVAALAADGTVGSPSIGMTVILEDKDAEAAWQAAQEQEAAAARAREAREAEEKRRRAEEQKPQEPDLRPGPYFVSAVDPENMLRGWWPMMGPFEKHQEALDLVEEVRRFAEKHDPRAYFYSWGTVRFTGELRRPCPITMELLRPPAPAPEAPRRRSSKRKAAPI